MDRRLTVAVAFVSALAASSVARAQEPGTIANVFTQAASRPEDAPVHAGPLAFAPVVQFGDIGRDDNVFASNGTGRIGDYTFTFTPAARIWVTSSRVNITATTQLHIAYFNRLTQLRSVNTDNSARVEFPLVWLTPFVQGSYLNTVRQSSLEVDAPVRRVENSVDVGAIVPATSRLSFEASVGRSSGSFRGNTLYYGTDLAAAFDHYTTGGALSVRYAVTDLTTIVLDMDRRRDNFTLSPDRNSVASSIVPRVEFSPFALLSGYAGVGFKKRSFDNGATPTFNSTVSFVALQYNALERTRFDVTFNRDLDFSYRLDASQYRLMGAYVGVRQVLADPLDVRVSFGRERLEYLGGAAPLGNATSISSSERAYTYGLTLGYQVGQGRVAVDVGYRQRESSVSSSRDYRRLRTAASLTYVF